MFTVVFTKLILYISLCFYTDSDSLTIDSKVDLRVTGILLRIVSCVLRLREVAVEDETVCDSHGRTTNNVEEKGTILLELNCLVPRN